MPWTASLIKSSSRYEDWIKVFGVAQVQVLEPMPRRANVCGKPETEIYLLDLKALTPEQLGRLVAHISEKFKIPREEVERDIYRQGVPILAEDVGVPIPMRFFY